jgi:cytochrome P450/NADPH-cytochrome P450 reductase
MPVFGPLAVKKMFPVMLDIASQMILKWDRLGAEHDISVSDDFTRLAFDTIGLAGFGYRFNSFYLDHPHEFAQQMAGVLTEAGRRSMRPAVETKLRIFSAQHTQDNVGAMWNLCDELVEERKAHP